jgi:hypothetical protein
MVLSFANFWWQCSGTLSNLMVTDPNNLADTIPPGPPISVTPGATAPTAIVVTGNKLDAKATFTFGSGITVANTTNLTTWTPGSPVTLNVSAAPGTAAGNRTLTVQNPDCSTAILANVLSIAGTSGSVKTAQPAKAAALAGPKPAKKAPKST